MSQRIEKWDFLKGILIIVVIYGHVCLYLTAHSYSQAFSPAFVFSLSQMPLFVLLSGMFAKQPKDFSSFLNIWKKYLTRLFVPFIIWCSVVVFEQRMIGIENSIIGSCITSTEIIWFIPMLLMAHFIFTSVSLLFRKSFNNCYVVALLIIGIFLSLFIKSRLYYFFFMFPFYAMGFLIKEIDFERIIKRRGGILLLFILALLVSYFFPSDLWFYSINNYIFDADNPWAQICFVVIRYICYFFVTISSLLLLLVVYHTIKGSKIANAIVDLGKGKTLFLYLAHVSLLYYPVNYIMNLWADDLIILQFPLVRYYIVSPLTTFLIVYLLTLLYKVFKMNWITKTFLVGL